MEYVESETLEENKINEFDLKRIEEKPLDYNSYSLDKIIAHGSFGIVYSGINKLTNRPVAVKRVFQDKRFKNREVEILKMVRKNLKKVTNNQ